jgi:hypothetical protein
MGPVTGAPILHPCQYFKWIDLWSPGNEILHPNIAILPINTDYLMITQFMQTTLNPVDYGSDSALPDSTANPCYAVDD